MDKERLYTHEEYVRLLQAVSEKEQKMEERMWLDSTAASFEDLLRREYKNSIEEFSCAVIDELAKLTNACSGVFYILDSEREKAFASAYHAGDLKKLSQKFFYPGDGLVGQAWSSKKRILFDNLPPEQISVEAGNIRLSAASLLVEPLIFNDEVYGVAELIFLRNVEPRFLELVRVLQKNIAATLETIYHSQLTKRLLGEAQTQAETLRSQEEELLQNMEEMSATQEKVEQQTHEAQAVRRELEARVTALDHLALVAELDKDGHFTYVNKRFRKATEFEDHELLGNPLSVLFPRLEGVNFERRVMTVLSEGKTFSEKQMIYTAVEEQVWVDVAITPLLSVDGEVQKSVMIALDISKNAKRVERLEEMLKTAQAESEELFNKEEQLKKEIYLKEEEIDKVRELAAEEKRDLLAFRSAMLVLRVTPDGTIISANENILSLLGYEDYELTGEHYTTIVPAEKENEFKSFWERVLTGKPRRGVFSRVTKGGDEVWLKSAYMPMNDEHGNLEEVLVICSDITFNFQGNG